MKKIAKLLVVPLAALLGAGGGFALKVKTASAEAGAHSGEADDSGAAHGPSDNAEKADETPHEAKGEKKKAGGGHQKPGEPATYMKFSRQFVAPIVRAGRPAAMMVLDINLELDPSAADEIYPEEPRLRDAVLRVLLEQSAEGKLEALFQDPALLEEMRAKILESARAAVGDDVRSVLIMDMGYQEM